MMGYNVQNPARNFKNRYYLKLFFYIIQDLNYTSIYCILIPNNFNNKKFRFSIRIQTDYRKADAILVNCDIFVYRRNYQD